MCIRDSPSLSGRVSRPNHSQATISHQSFTISHHQSASVIIIHHKSPSVIISHHQSSSFIMGGARAMPSPARVILAQGPSDCPQLCNEMFREAVLMTFSVISCSISATVLSLLLTSLCTFQSLHKLRSCFCLAAVFSALKACLLYTSDAADE